ncbi:putative C2H2 finger domain protein [Aspergillus heteromorphus CBS 117.55]|uniref:Putative C2H2 finger domain protein n=1 Tax=Aspergillus heteromorphus CBS 117.55 TaxID=1448321 RepID=A0A317URE3_9EURO|nr:putative C2H2 finger domain protein [Aspergillus heteromorphus CBS 117.55]PWY64524.1 putative C2H2 finger domain protein [Aspergillus heteromorphus CBS 117.55]
MAPRGFTNPTPKTESARSALSSFTCTLCNKSYSRHPEYEAHISSYDHQHRKRLQDLKQLSRDPNAAEKARRAERKADAEAGLRVIDTPKNVTVPTTGAGIRSGTSSGGGGFKKGGFKSSFTTVKGPIAPAAPTKKNVLGGDDEDNDVLEADDDTAQGFRNQIAAPSSVQHDQTESDTDEEYANSAIGGGYYNPRDPTGCFPGCPGGRDARLITSVV